MDDYALRFTGDPFLDGAIWGRGVKQSLNTAQVRVPHLPSEIIDRLDQRAQQTGLQTDYREIPLKMTRELELRLVLVSPDEIFRPLTAFRERRLVAGLPREFLLGFFTVCARVPLINQAVLQPEATSLSFNVFHEPVDDALEGLASLGVTQALPEGSTVTLEPGDYVGIADLENLRDAFLDEERRMRDEHGGTSYEFRMTHVLDQVEKQSLAESCKNFFSRIQLVESLDREAFRLPEATLTLAADRSKLHAQVLTDYCSLVGIEKSQTVSVIAMHLRGLSARYEQILAAHFRQSREFQLCNRMAEIFFERMMAGKLPDAPQESARAFFPVRGPTDVAVANFLVQTLLVEFFSADSKGLRATVPPEEAERLQSQLPDSIAVRARAAIDWFRGFTFDESNDEPFEILQRCGSCGEALVLASNQTCTECSMGLCQACFVMFASPMANPSPFAADARAPYCKVHSQGILKKQSRGYTPRALRDALRRRVAAS